MRLLSTAGQVLGACALGLALPCTVLAGACSGPITVGTGHWEPYAYFDARHRFTGIDIDMTRAIFHEAGCVLVELAPRPTTRNMMLFESGEIDMMMGASRTAERLGRARFSLAYRDETVGLYALAGNAGQYTAIPDFDAFVASRLAMLAPRVGWYGPAYQRHMQGLRDSNRLYQFIDYQQGIRMLAARRAEVMMGDASAVENAALHVGVKVRPLRFWLVQAPVHLMLNRDTVTAEDVARLDAAIERLRKRGAFARILRSYGGN